MKHLIGALFCVFALVIAPLSAAHDPVIGPIQGSSHAATPMVEHAHQVDKASHAGHAGMEQCEMMPGHCTIITLTQDIDFRRVRYGSAGLSIIVDDRLTAKFRPETELRPPKA